MPQPRRLSDAIEAIIAKKYRSGQLTAQLAAEYGVHKDTIRAALGRQNVDLRPRGGREGLPRRTPVAG